MTPGQQRALLVSFGVLVIGVVVNMMLLQPVTGSGRAGADAAQAKLEQERRQRLALDRLPQAQAATALVSGPARPAATEVGAVPLDAPAKNSMATAPPRVASGGPHPISIAPPMEQGARRFARLKPDAAKADAVGDILPDAPDAEGDPETIRAVQRELTTRGYGPLISDGVPGLVTRAAIMAFEHDNHLPLTGEATEKVLTHLLLGVASSGGAAGEGGAGKIRSAQAEIVMRTVQQSLVALGYQVGRVDGKTGDDTERAIREFELDQGLKPTGRVSAEVFGRLGRVVAAAKPQPVR